MKIQDTRLRIWILPVFVIAATSACSTPFSTNIYKFNDETPQEAAVITVSDPQIYARETLINDRLIERRLLNELLKESEEVEFRNKIGRPSMIRDLETLESLSLAAGLKYSPLAGTVQRRTEEIAELQHQIKVAKLERDLLGIIEGPDSDASQPEDGNGERNGNGSGDGDGDGNENDEGDGGEDGEGNGDGNGDGGDSGDPDGNGDGNNNGNGGDNGDDKSMDGNNNSDGGDSDDPKTHDLATLQSKSATRLEALAQRLGKRTVQVPISEAERARDAYRSELRHRLNALSLDDLHDYNGNSLYRMQFRATVFPGRHKDKFGVARLTFRPPILDDDDLNSLYRSWLLHLANRLNSPFPEVRNLCPEPVGSYLRLDRSPAVKLEQVRVYWKWNEPSNPDDESIHRFIRSTRVEANSKSFDVSSGRAEAQNSTNHTEGNTSNKSGNPERYCTVYVPLHPEGQLFSSEGIQTLSVIAALNRDHRYLSEALTRAIAQFVSASALPSSALGAPAVFKNLLSRAGMYDARDLIESANRYPDFSTARFETTALNRASRAAGSAYAYSISPLDKAQTISTQARTARSFEMALSLVAALPEAGVDGNLDLNRVRESAGIVEAFENQAIVVGFAERRGSIEFERGRNFSTAYGVDVQSPQVGWVFGPKVRIDAENSKLQLVHGFAAHEVSADLSIPGWWPRVDAVLETAWIGNTFASGRPIRLDDEDTQGFHRERFQVELPLNSADLDGLTEFIAGKLVGSSLPATAIQHVEPYYISACSADLRLLIRGPNVWRSATAFLGGVEATEITILPDMEGVAAKFNLDDMFALRNESTADLGLAHNVLLTIWTRNGSDQMALRMIGNRKVEKGDAGFGATSCIAPTTVSATTQPNRFEIIDVSPTQICQEWSEARLLVKAAHVRNSKLVTIFGNKNVAAEEKSNYGKNYIFEVVVDGGPFSKEPKNMVLTMSSGDDISSWPVRLVSCDKPTPKPPAQPTPTVKASKVLNTFVVADPKNTQSYSFEITLDDIDKSYFADDLATALRVGVLPKIQAAGNEWIASKTEPVPAPGNYKALFSVPKDSDSNPALAFREPQELKVALFQLINGVQRKTKEMKGGPIYYPDAASASVKLADGPSDLTKADSDVTLEFPWKHDKAFPDLGKAKLAAQVAGQSAIKLTVTADLSKVAERELKFKMKLEDDASETAWKALKGEQTVEFQLKGADQPLPKVAELIITRPN